MRSKSVCLCDDDNDVEMALACSHAYIPALSSDTMEETIQQNPKQFTKTFCKALWKEHLLQRLLCVLYTRE